MGDFLLLALLAFLYYLQRRNVLDLIITGVAMGFAGLTKSTAFVIVPK
jgi:4-amino-4-deoxy-L-arabinose transferase-like glycosyltransferase